MAGIYLRNQVTPFVILFIERDGSTYMVSMLSTHPQINADYERFAVMKVNGQSATEQIQWAKDLFSPSLITRQKAVGFKTKLKDVLDIDAFTELLNEKGVHIIQMHRRNVIKAAVSVINARRLHEKTGVWNLRQESDRLPPATIDLDEFDHLVQQREMLDQELAAYVSQFQLPRLQVCYEDLLVDRDGVLRQIFDFIGVDWFDVQGSTKKNTGDDLREAIANYDDLRARYAGTRYEEMFDEVLV